jgi:hypothetical protein
VSESYPVLVRQQVWESLVSMVQVYAHAANLNGGKECLVTSFPDEAWVRRQNSALNLRFQSDTGEGYWSVTQPEREDLGTFRIEDDGTLIFPAGPKSLDTAAIEWLEYLVHETSSPSNEPRIS